MNAETQNKIDKLSNLLIQSKQILEELQLKLAVETKAWYKEFDKVATALEKTPNDETLQIKYKDKNIYDVLEMTVSEAYEFFENIPKVKKKLEVLLDVGLGYIKIGQPATTLSGGEAQRVKLATELSKRSTGKTIYILDDQPLL